jgi:hypothetical protein
MVKALHRRSVEVAFTQHDARAFFGVMRYSHDGLDRVASDCTYEFTMNTVSFRCHA